MRTLEALMFTVLALPLSACDEEGDDDSRSTESDGAKGGEDPDDLGRPPDGDRPDPGDRDDLAAAEHEDEGGGDPRPDVGGPLR